jgi:hypothetical protein
MIYNGVPLKYCFIPTDIESGIFIINFIPLFGIFLKNASIALMAVVDDEYGKYSHFNEGAKLNFAYWAKQVYKINEKIALDVCKFYEYIEEHKYESYIWNNTKMYNMEFDFYDYNMPNVMEGLKIWNQLTDIYKEKGFYYNLFE